MKSSFRMAYGGIVAALSLVCMFLSGVFPFAEYALPAMAGLCLVALVIEFGYKTAVIAYVAISLLSLLVTPNKEAVILFIVFFGYYPVLKGRIESLRKPVMEWIIKLVWFNFAAVLAYFVMIHILGMTEVMEDFAFLQYGVWLILLLGNGVFILYDVAVTRVIVFFLTQIRPKYFKKMR